MSAPDRRGMLDRDDKLLSVRRQCALLGVARSGVYRQRKPANDNDLGLMRRIALSWRQSNAGGANRAESGEISFRQIASSGSSSFFSRSSKSPTLSGRPA